MLPTLNGRIQIRIIVLGFVGFWVALILTPFFPRPEDVSIWQGYRASFSVLLAVILVGILWELLYHFLQQFRWEKDWPTLFGLLTSINEGIVIYLLIKYTTIIVPEHLKPSLTVFLIQFIVTWLAFWLIVNGPMRVPFHRWRFAGGRLL